MQICKYTYVSRWREREKENENTVENKYMSLQITLEDVLWKAFM